MRLWFSARSNSPSSSVPAMRTAPLIGLTPTLASPRISGLVRLTPGLE